MDHVDLESSVPDWIIEYPHIQPLFESLDIDYSCGGKSLEVACLERGLDPVEIAHRIQQMRSAE